MADLPVPVPPRRRVGSPSRCPRLNALRQSIFSTLQNGAAGAPQLLPHARRMLGVIQCGRRALLLPGAWGGRTHEARAARRVMECGAEETAPSDALLDEIPHHTVVHPPSAGCVPVGLARCLPRQLGAKCWQQRRLQWANACAYKAGFSEVKAGVSALVPGNSSVAHGRRGTPSAAQTHPCHPQTFAQFIVITKQYYKKTFRIVRNTLGTHKGVPSCFGFGGYTICCATKDDASTAIQRRCSSSPEGALIQLLVVYKQHKQQDTYK